jgi:SAM-dependent methyltransferase
MDYNIDYNDISENYSIYRNASPTVVDHILEKIKNKNIKEILEIGCGTADYLYALTQQLKCNSYGFDNSENMISEANKKNPGLKLKINDLHKVFDYNDNFFDLVYSIDVVHYVKDLDDLENRTITKYFPESLEIEMKRYPGVNEIIENMKNSDFKGIEISHTEKEYKMDEKIFQKFKNKAFSAIRLISEESFEKGIKKVKKDMKNNKCLVKELYTYIWGVKQHF